MDVLRLNEVSVSWQADGGRESARVGPSPRDDRLVDGPRDDAGLLPLRIADEASLVKLLGGMASAPLANFSALEKLGLPALAISLRSCAASYSSASRRLA